MKKKLAIYLAGSIKKAHERSEELYWSENDMDFLKKSLYPYEVSFLNPAIRQDDLSDQMSVFGRDMTQVYCSDFVFVDARERRGLGVGAEMMWAKINTIPVITLAPKDSHYNKSETSVLGVSVKNWVHPFIECLSDVFVESLEKGVLWMKTFLSDSKWKIKDRKFIEKAMQYYKENQLERDESMKDLISLNEKLFEKIHLRSFKN